MPRIFSSQSTIARPPAAGLPRVPAVQAHERLARAMERLAPDPARAGELARSVLAGLEGATLDLCACELRHPGLAYDLDQAAWEALDDIARESGAPGITALSLPEPTDAPQLRACIEEINALAHLRTLTVRVPVEGRLVDLRGLRHPPQRLQVRLACWRPSHWVVYAPKGLRVHAQGNEGLAGAATGQGLRVHRFGADGPSRLAA